MRVGMRRRQQVQKRLVPLRSLRVSYIQCVSPEISRLQTGLERGSRPLVQRPCSVVLFMNLHAAWPYEIFPIGMQALVHRTTRCPIRFVSLLPAVVSRAGFRRSVVVASRTWTEMRGAAGWADGCLRAGRCLSRKEK